MRVVSTALFAGMVGCAIALHAPAANAGKTNEKVLYSFCSQQNCTDGADPTAGVIDVNGTLYNTTVNGGGASISGTVFALDRKTGGEKVVYSFCSQQKCTDGWQPEGGVIEMKHMLFGTTTGGGTDTAGCGDSGCGTVFAVDPNTGAETVVHSFGAGMNGQIPFAGVTDVNGILYGTTAYGETYGNGTVFALNPNTGTETVLHSFGSGTDGLVPYAGVIAVKRKLYGTTYGGGIYGYGLVFSIDPNTGAEKMVYSFAGGKDGGDIPGGLIVVKGILYGTTSGGGSGAGCGNVGCGTVFALDPSTGAETVLYSFCSQQRCTDGAIPSAGMIFLNGSLYGTTSGGGTGNCGGGCGTVFSLDPNTSTETVLYSFCNQQPCMGGKGPAAGLIAVKRKLYGTTRAGGTSNDGTVFALKR